MEEKVKCRLCGKVGLVKDKKGLRRHLRLCHDKNVSKECSIETYYEPADPESIVEIKSVPLKSFVKERNRKKNKKRRETITGKNPFVKIIYTPMVNG